MTDEKKQTNDQPESRPQPTFEELVEKTDTLTLVKALRKAIVEICPGLEEARQAFKRKARDEAKVKRQLDNLIDILLGDIHQHYPETLREHLLSNGFTEEQIKKMTPREYLQEARKYAEAKPDRTETMVLAASLLFEARYGWTEEQVKRMSISEVILALEHALEYDDPDKPCIWSITK